MSIEVFGPGTQEDVDAIVALVAEVQRAQQNELPTDFMNLFRRHDPVWTTGHGVRLAGWDTISEFTHKVLPGATVHGTATYEVVRILFIRPDIAAVNVHQTPVELDGTPKDGPEGRPFYILAKDADTWQIAAAQNTQVHQ